MIVITGASDGLGKELAALFIADGKHVVGLSRGKCGPGVEHIPTDLMDVESLNKAICTINNNPEPLEALINCAGVLSIEKIEALTAKEINKVLKTNVRAPLLVTSGLMNKIKKDGTDIVNVASSVGFKGYVDQATYGASKWAVRGLSANLQTELKDYPSRVISFCPGGFKTELFAKATGTDNTSTGEWMSARDIATCLKQLLELPKNMEVSEITVNRKTSTVH
jgi:NADP-dependent 3-hydroxy acid dehydrogenase YdfG